jgi:hypothetical protein
MHFCKASCCSYGLPDSLLFMKLQSEDDFCNTSTTNRRVANLLPPARSSEMVMGGFFFSGLCMFRFFGYEAREKTPQLLISSHFFNSNTWLQNRCNLIWCSFLSLSRYESSSLNFGNSPPVPVPVPSLSRSWKNLVDRKQFWRCKLKSAPLTTGQHYWLQHAKMSKACLEIYGFPETEANALTISRVVRNCRRGNRQQANEAREDAHNDNDDFFAASSREREREGRRRGGEEGVW